MGESPTSTRSFVERRGHELTIPFGSLSHETKTVRFGALEYMPVCPSYFCPAYDEHPISLSRKGYRLVRRAMCESTTVSRLSVCSPCVRDSTLRSFRGRQTTKAVAQDQTFVRLCCTTLRTYLMAKHRLAPAYIFLLSANVQQSPFESAVLLPYLHLYRVDTLKVLVLRCARAIALNTKGCQEPKQPVASTLFVQHREKSDAGSKKPPKFPLPFLIFRKILGSINHCRRSHSPSEPADNFIMEEVDSPRQRREER